MARKLEELFTDMNSRLKTVAEYRWFNPSLREEALNCLNTAQAALDHGLDKQAEAQVREYERLCNQDAYEGFPQLLIDQGILLEPAPIPLNLRQLNEKGFVGSPYDAWIDKGIWILEWQQTTVVYERIFSIPRFRYESFPREHIQLRRLACNRYPINSDNYVAPFWLFQYIDEIRKVVADDRMSVFVEIPVVSRKMRDPVLAVEVGSGWYMIVNWK